MALDIIKISSLAGLSLPAAGDLLLIIDVSEAVDVDKTKSITFANIGTYVNLAVEVEKSAAHTFGLTDAGKIISLTGSTGYAFTIPANASVEFPIGTNIAMVKDGTGNITITPADGVSVKYEIGLVLSEQYAMAAIVKVALNTWRAIGNLGV